ncbi:SdrD B-like domain-containing protein [Yoonia sp. SS1-5]|uniref:SdrD B-like domain-containing protein n=1 Tax=Yoonia rhodophyticola TaxID=3137370 RepID=A0AAN0M9X6_9RHOB
MTYRHNNNGGGHSHKWMGQDSHYSGRSWGNTHHDNDGHWGKPGHRDVGHWGRDWMDFSHPDFECPPCDGPDAVKIDFEEFRRGEKIQNIDDFVTIEVHRATHCHYGNQTLIPGTGMIFDTGRPSGRDYDLAHNREGKVLIISEDNDSHDPDDNRHGGTVSFDFKSPVSVTELTVIDTEEGGSVDLFDAHGNLIKSIALPHTRDGGVKRVPLDTDDVAHMTITLHGSGAIDDICYVPPAPSASVSGTFFIDENDNAVQDASDSVVANAKVKLLLDGVVVDHTRTDHSGNYRFDDIAPGDDYAVVFVNRDSALTFVAGDVDDDDTIDSDVLFETKAGNGRTATFSLSADEDMQHVDAGLVAANVAPVAADDAATICAEETGIINVLANDTDADDGDSLAVTAVNGVAVDIGDTVTLDSGATVTVNDGGVLSYDSNALVVDGVSAADLLIGTSVSDSFTYTVSDGRGGTDDATVTMTVDGARNTLPDIFNSLPDTAMVVQGGMSIKNGYSSRVDETGDARFDGIRFEAAYCIERDEAFIPNIDVAMNVYGGVAGEFDASLFSNDFVENLDAINWLLNQDFTAKNNGDTTGAGAGQNYTEIEIQHAIWGLTDDNSELMMPEAVGGHYNGTQENIDTLLALAHANGEGFVPGDGDMVTIILDPIQAQANAPVKYRKEDSDYDLASILVIPFEDLSLIC